MFKRFVSGLLVGCFLIVIASSGFAEGGYVVVPAQKTFLSAESRLKELSKKAGEQRMSSGMNLAGFGILYVALGAAYGKSSYGSDYSSLYYAMGGGMLVLGLRSLIYPTELENNYTDVRKMPAASVKERGARELSAETALRKGADEAAQGRRISSTVLGGSGLLFMASSPFYGALFLGTAALSYFMKSDVEKAYDEYLADKEEFIRSQPQGQSVTPEAKVIVPGVWEGRQ